jgi:antitoxin component of MazEF toxin-antitoxin module
MTSIDTTFTTSGNSAAVRVPRELMRMSGLNGKSKIKISAKKNQIIITKSINPREGWEEQIDSLLLAEGDPINEFDDMKAADNDGLSDLPWDGPSFAEWQKTHGKVS